MTNKNFALGVAAVAGVFISAIAVASEPTDYYLQYVDPNNGVSPHEVQYRDLPEFPEFWLDEVARPWVTIQDVNDASWPHCRKARIASPEKGEIRARLIRNGITSGWSNILPFDNTTNALESDVKFVDHNDADIRTTAIELEWRGEAIAENPMSIPIVQPWVPLPNSKDELWDRCRMTTVVGLGDGILRSRFLGPDGTPNSEWSNPVFVPEPGVIIMLIVGAMALGILWMTKK